MDQVVPLPETQRTEPTPNAAPTTGSDTPIHTATPIEQLSCRRGAGGCLSVCVLHVCAFCTVSFAMFFPSVLVYFVTSRYSFTYFMTWMPQNLHRQTGNSSAPKLDFLPTYALLCAERNYEIFPGDEFSATAYLGNVFQLMGFFVTQVAMLVEMGFSRIDALEALRASNNDINMATNFLLQH